MTDSKTKQAILKMREDGMPLVEIASFFSLPPIPLNLSATVGMSGHP